MADIMNGRYALADPGSGLTVLSLEGGELNMFGRCTRIRTIQRDFYPQIQDEPTELKVENNIVAQLVTGLVVAAALAAVAVAVVVTGGAALAPLACALGGAALGVGAVAIGTAVNDSETGCNRSWEDYWEELITGSCIGFMAGASIYGIVAAVPAAAGAAATMFGTSVFTSTAAHVIATVGGYGLAAASGLYTANDIYSNSRGYNAILDKIFDNDIEAYETVGMVLDLFGEMYVSLGESNRALGNRSNNDAGEPREESQKKSASTGDNNDAGIVKNDNVQNAVDNNAEAGMTKGNSIKNFVESDNTETETTQGNTTQNPTDNKSRDIANIEVEEKVYTVMNFNKDQVIDSDTDLIGIDKEGIYIEYGSDQNNGVTDNDEYEQVVQRYASNQGTGNNSIVTVSNKKMWQLGKHFDKHGRAMGYQSAADYDAGAKAFAKNMQNDPNTKIFEGQWNGKGRLNNTTQIAITNSNKTVIVDAGTGQIIDFYMGNTYGGLINLRQIK